MKAEIFGDVAVVTLSGWDQQLGFFCSTDFNFVQKLSINIWHTLVSVIVLHSFNRFGGEEWRILTRYKRYNIVSRRRCCMCNKTTEDNIINDNSTSNNYRILIIL